jgi:hypothetical protein
MTLPYERRWAVNNTRQFLLDVGTNESLPEEVRKEAWRNLKHYPGEYYMEEARKEAPEVFGDWEDMKHD